MWIMMSWQLISPEVTVKGPMKWMGWDEDMLWNDSEEVRNVRSKCEADEDTECKDRESDTDW
jgi:hypothetical protein